MSIMSYKQTLALMAGALADHINPHAPRADRSVPAPARECSKIFLADNSRLRRDAEQERERVETICQQHGLAAEWPSEHFLLPAGLTAAQRAAAGLPLDGDREPSGTLRKAWRLIGKCDAVVAEVTPFRGPHLNPVIAFEIGIAVVQEIPVFAWTSVTYPAFPGAPSDHTRPRTLEDRVWCGEEVARDGFWRDDQGSLVENFGLVECAAIAGNFVSVSTSQLDAIRICAEYLARQDRQRRWPLEFCRSASGTGKRIPAPL